MTTTGAGLRRLLSPRSIAVIGGAPAERVVRQCRLLGFDGEMWPVHPTRESLDGIRCVRSLDDLPAVPDAVFVGVNRHATVATVSQLWPLGVGGAVCYGSGFAESGGDGIELQDELVRVAGDMPLLGPNCYGYVNAFDGVALWPDEHGCARVDSGAAIVAQSGNVGLNLTFQQRGLRLGYLVTVGNQAVLGVEDCLDAFLDDERVTSIGLFVEAVRDPVRFTAAARRARARGVPIVALQTGRSETGAGIAASHTASLAGHHAAYAALFEREGIASVETPAELIETLKLLDTGGPLGGPRIVSMSCSGGEASLVADRSEGTILELAPFADDHRARIESTLTELVAVSNPFDYHTFMWGDRAAMAACFGAVMDGPQDATVLVLDAPPGADNDQTSWLVALDALADAAAATQRRAVLLSTFAECATPELRERAIATGIAPLQGLSEGLRALAAAAQIGMPEDRSTAAVHVAAVEPRSTRLVDEAAAKARLVALGVPVPTGVVAPAIDDVVKAAATVGYPVTLKALGIAHKSESGGVVVGVRDEDALRRDVAAMPTTAAGLLIEATVEGAVAEVLVAVRRDPPVGWLVTIGAGGVMTELLDDTVHLLAPVTADEVRAAVHRLRTFPLLDGFRGRPAADVDALVDLVVGLTRAVVGTDAVEVELNPVLLRGAGGGAVAVDALWIEEVAG